MLVYQLEWIFKRSFLSSLRLSRFILVLSLVSLVAQAQKLNTNNEFNKILFSVSGQSWTSRDQQAFDIVLNEVFKKKKLTTASETELEDFLLSRLSEKESSLFDLSFAAVKLTEQQRKKMNFLTSAEVNREVEMISKAIAILDLKETQQKDPVRFKAWFELLKRKYQLKMKSS